MRASEIYATANAALDTPIRWPSVKGILSAYTLGGDRRFSRVERGVYDLRSRYGQRRFRHPRTLVRSEAGRLDGRRPSDGPAQVARSDVCYALQDSVVPSLHTMRESDSDHTNLDRATRPAGCANPTRLT
jgi:hypothetical protein